MWSACLNAAPARADEIPGRCEVHLTFWHESALPRSRTPSTFLLLLSIPPPPDGISKLWVIGSRSSDHRDIPNGAGVRGLSRPVQGRAGEEAAPGHGEWLCSVEGCRSPKIAREAAAASVKLLESKKAQFGDLAKTGTVRRPCARSTRRFRAGRRLTELLALAKAPARRGFNESAIEAPGNGKRWISGVPTTR